MNNILIYTLKGSTILFKNITNFKVGLDGWITFDYEGQIVKKTFKNTFNNISGYAFF